MTVDLRNVDLSNVQANAVLEAIPAGWYDAVITETAMKETNDKTGQYMEVISEIVNGPHKGRKLFDRLNLVNSNAQAVSIAYGTLKQIYNACGKARVNSSAELHGIPLKVKLSLRPAETKGDKTYEARNEVKGYDHISSNHTLVAGVAVAVVPGVAGAPSGVPAWADNKDAVAVGQPQPAAQSTSAPAPLAAATIPTGAQPWSQPGQPAPAVTASELRMTDKANGLTKEDFYKQGWKDDQLVDHGFAVRIAQTPPPAPVATVPSAPSAPLGAPGAPGLAAPATAAPGGPVPPWA